MSALQEGHCDVGRNEAREGEREKGSQHEGDERRRNECERRERRRKPGRTSFFHPFNQPSISSLWKTCPQGRIRTTSPSWKSSRQIEHCEDETKGTKGAGEKARSAKGSLFPLVARSSKTRSARKQEGRLTSSIE